MVKTSMLLVGFLSIHFASLFGQHTVPVFPNETGQALLTKVVDSYKTPIVLEYGPARDVLYGTVYKQNDSVACIYTDHKLPLPAGQDPTDYLYLNGQPNGINAEHSYPQSKGASSGNAQSDMHHIFPARVWVNSARASFPFAEIPDNETQKWYWKTSELGGTPNINKDEYSEGTNGRFEPREVSKGNIARAILYFYTMYKAEADAADPNFFAIQRPYLCQWHYADPVDSMEWVRTWRIATYQDGKANPFILDCSLATRAYCSDMPGTCPTLPIVDAEEVGQPLDLISVFPNPSTEEVLVKSPSPIDAWYLFNMAGKPIHFMEIQPANTALNIDVRSLPTGMYILFLESNGQIFSKKISKN